MLPEDKLNLILRRHEELSAKLAEGASGAEFATLSREYADLEEVVAAIRAWRAAQDNLKGIEDMLADPAVDAEMRELAEAERDEARETVFRLEQQIRIALLPKDVADEGGAILEVRAGTGGDEAALFAGDLFRMYQRYAESKGWKVELLSASEGTAGGYKEIIAGITGRGVFAKLKFESGVHRVQRVPDTETQGRIHTTGTVVMVQDERSQHKNRARAMGLLKARLYDAERQKLDAERAADRKSQVGSGDRSERIRTYNFPQGRVTDHRINLTLYKLDKVITGEALDDVVDPLITEHQAAQLAASEG